MEESAVVVAIQTMLQEVARGDWSLFSEEFEEDVTARCVEEDFGSGLRLEGVVGAHFRGVGWDWGLGGPTDGFEERCEWRKRGCCGDELLGMSDGIGEESSRRYLPRRAGASGDGRRLGWAHGRFSKFGIRNAAKR